MQNLDKYSIYELRQIARSFGVKSPTTKRKALLIKEIKLINEHKLNPVYTKKGRPSKIIDPQLNTLCDNANIKLQKSDICSFIEYLKVLINKLETYL